MRRPGARRSGATRPPAFQAGHNAYLSLSAACTVSAPAIARPGSGSCSPPLSPIGLTAADLFAGGEVSRADSRVRWPGTFTDARCPAVRSALDAVPEACHNPAAVWWGPLQLPRPSATRWSLSTALAARGVMVQIRSGWTNALARSLVYEVAPYGTATRTATARPVT